MQTRPWHSVVGHQYHTETECVYGQWVRAEYRCDGTGGRPKCDNWEATEGRRACGADKRQF